MVEMDRALFGDKPLIIFIPIYCFLVFNFEFYFVQRYCTKVASLCAIGETLLQCTKGCWQPSGKFVIGRQRLLATLWQILQRALATFANSTYLPKGCQHPLILGHRVLITLTLQSNCQRILDKLYRHLQEGCPINKKRGNLFAIPLKKLKVKINIQKATDSFKNCKRFIFQLSSVALYHL